jgi:hypothetical protein
MIRRTASVGDWVIGTGSKNSVCNDGKKYDLSECLVYAMKITDIKTLKDYDKYCNKNLKDKIPDWGNRNWKKQIGDCIYDYSSNIPSMRVSVHNSNNRKRDLSGINALLSTEFYYFGENAILIPQSLKKIIKKSQGHLKILNQELINEFEVWMKSYKKNKLYGEPQMKHLFTKKSSRIDRNTCAMCHSENDKGKEKIIC